MYSILSCCKALLNELCVEQHLQFSTLLYESTIWSNAHAHAVSDPHVPFTPLHTGLFVATPNDWLLSDQGRCYFSFTYIKKTGCTLVNRFAVLSKRLSPCRARCWMQNITIVSLQVLQFHLCYHERSQNMFRERTVSGQWWLVDVWL